MRLLVGRRIEALLEEYGFVYRQVLTSEFIRALEIHDTHSPAVLRLTELEGQDEEWYVDSYCAVLYGKFDTEDDIQWDAVRNPVPSTEEDLLRLIIQRRDEELGIIEYAGLFEYYDTDFD